MIKGLYIHIPFCDRICSYCDFAKLVANDDLKKRYMDSLIRELYHYKSKYNDISTIYIGGGTPSSLNPSLLEMLLIAVHDVAFTKNVEEYTIETNPNDISSDFLALCHRYGINRVSVGVQTISKEGLEILGRNHTKKEVVEAIRLIEESPIKNYNLDFIYGIPNQTWEDLRTDLSFIKTHKPPHISYYSLILEQNTLLTYRINQKVINPLDDDLAADYAVYIRDTLQSFGYEHYEFSNYALPDANSKHNMLYWNLEEYIGLGMNASGQYDNHRFVNPSRITDYIHSIDNHLYNHRIDDFQPEMEFILMGLRKLKGIDLNLYRETFGKDVLVRYPGLQKYIKSGLLEITDHHLHFTEVGVLLSNQVYLEII